MQHHEDLQKNVYRYIMYVGYMNYRDFDRNEIEYQERVVI